ncbi:MAG: hypothetical protein AB1632_10450 [Nitrospirota bacterium]
MKCPYLTKWVVSSCKACDKPYAPSLFELQEYCRSISHTKCPFYLMIVSRGYEILYDSMA